MTNRSTVSRPAVAVADEDLLTTAKPNHIAGQTKNSKSLTKPRVDKKNGRLQHGRAEGGADPRATTRATTPPGPSGATSDTRSMTSAGRKEGRRQQQLPTTQPSYDDTTRGL